MMDGSKDVEGHSQDKSEAKDNTSTQVCEEKAEDNSGTILSDPATAENGEISEEKKSLVENDIPDDPFLKPPDDLQARIEALIDKRLAESQKREQDLRENKKTAYEFSSEKVFRGKFLEPIHDEHGDIIGYKNPLHIGHLDLKVGQVLMVGRHPKPSKGRRYVETISINPNVKLSNDFMGSLEDVQKIKEERRLVVESGLSKQYSSLDLENLKIVVLCNPKPFTSRGVESKVVVLCAKKGDEIELLQAPRKAQLGSSIYVKGYAKNPQKPYVVNANGLIENDLRVNKDKQVVYKDKPLQVEGTEGYITTRTLSDCGVSNVMGYEFI